MTAVNHIVDRPRAEHQHAEAKHAMDLAARAVLKDDPDAAYLAERALRMLNDAGDPARDNQQSEQEGGRQ